MTTRRRRVARKAQSNRHQKPTRRSSSPKVRSPRENRHHVLFERSIWKGEDYEALRGDHLMIVTLNQRVHEILHFEDVVPPVPPPGRNAARTIRNEFVRLRSQCNWLISDRDVPQDDTLGISLMCRAIDSVIDPRIPVGGHRISRLEAAHLELIKSNILTQQLFVLWNEELEAIRDPHYRMHAAKVPSIEKVAQMSGNKIIDLLESRYGSSQRRLIMSPFQRLY